MAEDNDPREVAEALAIHEDTMSALYGIYADQYPQVSALWKTMSREEHSHGRMLRSLLDMVADLQPFVDGRRYDLDQIRADTRKLNGVVQVAPAAGLPMQDAFRSAIHLEDSLIESQVLVSMAGDPPEVAAVLDALKEQTEAHRQHLKESFSVLGT